MTTKIVPGSLVAVRTPGDVVAEASARAARVLREAVTERGAATVALSGGFTPREAYTRLAAEAIDWMKVQVFLVDDRAVPPDRERSNYRMIKETLVDPARIPAANVHRMASESSDLEAAARAYEDLIREHVRLRREDVPSLDLVILGIGDDGHTASLFPGQPEISVTDTLVCVVPAKGDREARLTMTVPMLENARSALVLAVGSPKHEPLERVWRVAGTVEETPARIMRSFRGSVTWIIDRQAGGM